MLSWAAGLYLQLQLFEKPQWEHRNSVVHARNEKGRKVTSERDIATRLDHQLRLGIRFLPAQVNNLVDFAVESALKEPRSKMLTWLHHLELQSLANWVGRDSILTSPSTGEMS